jgi:hypothetical protein
LDIATINAQRRPLSAILKGATRCALRTVDFASIAGLITTGVVFITQTHQALLAGASDAGLASGCRIRIGVGAKAHTRSVVGFAIIAHGARATGLAAILTVAIRDAKIRGAI